MPERVEAIAVVSGAPPIAELEDHSGLLKIYRLDAGAARCSSKVARDIF